MASIAAGPSRQRGLPRAIPIRIGTAARAPGCRYILTTVWAILSAPVGMPKRDRFRPSSVSQPIWTGGGKYVPDDIRRKSYRDCSVQFLLEGTRQTSASTPDCSVVRLDPECRLRRTAPLGNTKRLRVASPDPPDGAVDNRDHRWMTRPLCSIEFPRLHRTVQVAPPLCLASGFSSLAVGPLDFSLRIAASRFPRSAHEGLVQGHGTLMPSAAQPSCRRTLDLSPG